MDLYEKYLLFPDLVDDDDEYYCNCSHFSRFGKSCQYIVDTDDDERSFNELFLGVGRSSAYEQLQKETFTCYVGILCETNLFCLDWRQICNGVVDCDGGEDEPFDLCLQMESSQCHPETEFRCKTGLCIPVLSITTETDHCPGLSSRFGALEMDLSMLVLLEYLQTPHFNHEENNHGWKQFACGNGQYISFSHLTVKVNGTHQTCINNHHLMYLRQLFVAPDEDQCWKSMICLTGFDYLFSNIDCYYETILTNIERSCPNEFYFPSKSVVYSFVFFLYDKVKRNNWFNYTGPNYICYKEEYCPSNTLVSATISKKNLKCFSVNETIFSWTNFYESVLHLFSSCYVAHLPSAGINETMLYACQASNTFISIYRLKDKKKDCFYNDDEDSNINLCSLNTNDQFKCLTVENECVRQSVLDDNHYDCSDGSDEYVMADGPNLYAVTSHLRPITKRILPEIYRFDELCDNVVNRHVFSLAANETDETDCEHWPYSCNSLYTRCDRIWNCANGEDEIDCEFNLYNMKIQQTLRCKSNEHYCIQLINGNHDMNATCISMDRSGDGVIDCIGGTDERLTTGSCTQNYPIDFKNRFRCLNSSICIRSDQVCDTIFDCPLEDDERICPWLSASNSSQFHCESSSLHFVDRCDLFSKNDLYCLMREHLWFCDLSYKRFGVKLADRSVFEPYPPIDKSLTWIPDQSFDSNQLSIPDKRTFASSDTSHHMLLCHLGYLIRSSTSNNRSYCFCPPSYYGDYCQYQSERLTAILQIKIRYSMNPLTVFRLIVYLLNENNLTLSHDEIVYNHAAFKYRSPYVVYLLYERVQNLSLYQRSKSKVVRVDSYIIKETDVQYILSWFLPVSFPFLPVNRIVAELSLHNRSLRMINCSRRCGAHGKCMYYVNARHIEYCWCERGWFGKRCEEKSSTNLCNQTSCAPHAQCVILNDEKKQMKCICPLGKSGDQCYITHDICTGVSCKNNGTCLPLDRRNNGYICICKDGYTGRYCEDLQRYSNISVDADITNPSSIPAIMVILGYPAKDEFRQNYQVMYKNINLPTTLKLAKPGEFAFVQIFHNLSKSFYYVVRILPESGPYFNTSVITRNRCPNVTELFNHTILHDYSYLKRLKLYHLPCQNNHHLRCFFDEYRMCICTRDHNSECYLFSHEVGNCDYCQNGGFCLRQNSDMAQWTYTCLCPQCSYGSVCQFSLANYFITLDMLIGVDMQTGNASFNQQPTIIHLTFSVLVLILVFSLIFNTICIIVFSNKKLRQVGCDLYLLNLSIISEIGLILLFLRFIYIIMVRMYVIENARFLRITCRSLEYLLHLTPSLFDWFTVCISIERTYTVIKDVHFTKVTALKTLKISRWMILIVFLGNILTTLHRPFYLTLVDELSFDDEPQGHPWCVLDFQTTSWDVYEKVINVCHLLLPLLLNLLSIIFFISYKTKLEITLAAKKNKTGRLAILKGQLLKYKPLLIDTGMIILLEIPRFVFTFTRLYCACMATIFVFDRIFNLILPLAGVVFIYIIPSPKYKPELKKAINRVFRRSLFQTARG